MTKMEYEEMGMTEQQFASCLNQVIARLEDVLEIEDEGKRAEKLRKVIEDVKEDRDSNM